MMIRLTGMYEKTSAKTGLNDAADAHALSRYRCPGRASKGRDDDKGLQLDDMTPRG